jgi:hypothetical protein
VHRKQPIPIGPTAPRVVTGDHGRHLLVQGCGVWLHAPLSPYRGGESAVPAAEVDDVLGQDRADAR